MYLLSSYERTSKNSAIERTKNAKETEMSFLFYEQTIQKGPGGDAEKSGELPPGQGVEKNMYSTIA